VAQQTTLEKAALIFQIVGGVAVVVTLALLIIEAEYASPD
jgi:hypothetical protein